MKRYIISALLLATAPGAKAQLRVDTAKVITPATKVNFTDLFASYKPLLPVQPVATDFYTQHLPFFCRQELKMQQAHIPLQVRVGSIDDCNWLERKRGYVYRP